MFKRETFNNLLVRLLGWFSTLLHGDPTLLDRWLWLRGRLRAGDIRTLDAGCGSGAFSLYAAKRGNEVVGLSFDERNNSIAAERAEILGLHRTTFLTRDLREIDSMRDELGRFDQILCFEVVEHIMDDQKLIDTLSGLLRPGGRLLLTTPSDRHRPFSGERVSDTEDGGHVRFGYSLDDLQRLFDDAGLETLRLEYLVGPISQRIIWLQRKFDSVGTLFAWAATVPLRPLQLLDPLASRAFETPPYCVCGIAIRPGP